jgi:3-methylcrotonyl-CoA carboxylase alpha subunit
MKLSNHAFKRILIANRGEIACRIIRTLNRLHIESVAVYSEADRFSPHVHMATHAFCIGPASPLQSYLNIESILKVAKEAQVDAIHPGYGFLSENPEFAEACEQANVVFIGPNSQAMRAVGSKQMAKALLTNAKHVRLIPGFHPKNPDNDSLEKAAHDIGFPVVIKATHGGGGKGLKIIHDPKDFKLGLESARREAKSYFNNDELMLEKLIQHPRHLEVQIIADQHGHAIHLFERDCSVQRRQQKIIEEAPAIKLSDAIRKELYAAALEVTQTFDYTNAGTVEFLLEDNQNLYFMEMNARLQVEHPITEMITGLDLVEWQIKIAEGKHLTIQQPEKPHGHAIECRICAEIPELDFKPSQGTISDLQWPKEARIDTGIQPGQTIESHYDSLLAKSIVWADTRDEAIHLMQQSLKNTVLLGLQTNVPYLQQLLQEPQWLQGAVPIDYLQHLQLPESDWRQENKICALLAMHSIEFWKNQPLPNDWVGFHLHHPAYYPKTLQIDETLVDIWLQYICPGQITWRLSPSSSPLTIHYQYQHPYLQMDVNGERFQYQLEWTHPWRIHSHTECINVNVLHHKPQQQSTNDQEHCIMAPMPATIVAILKNQGDLIAQGEPLLILEAMKMEHTIYAPHDGMIKHLFYKMGQQVQEGQQLIELSHGE